LATLLPPRWVSQVPRLIYPRALSPTTPGGPMAASARFFTIGSGLHHSSAGWPLSICVTRPNRVHLRYGSRVRSAGLRPFGLLRGPPAPLPAERAINRVTSFQVTRSARLSLAHRGRKSGQAIIIDRYPSAGKAAVSHKQDVALIEKAQSLLNLEAASVSSLHGSGNPCDGIKSVEIPLSVHQLFIEELEVEGDGRGMPASSLHRRTASSAMALEAS